MEAIEDVRGRGIKTKDLGGRAGTEEVTEAVCRAIEKLGPRHMNGHTNGEVKKDQPLCEKVDLGKME